MQLGDKNLSLKLSRTILLITVIIISTFIGGIFVLKATVPSFQIKNFVISNLDNDENNTIPQNYTRRGVEQFDACCGHTDVNGPSIKSSPKDNSFVLAGATIKLIIQDDNPFNDFKTTQVLYHWDNDQSNTTLSDPDENLVYEVIISNDNGPYVLYVYAVDYDENWSSATLHFTVVPAGDPPTLDLVAPSASNETLNGTERNGMFVFLTNVTDDFGPINVKMQIDSGATPAMVYNESSGYYYQSTNISEITNGYHWLKVTAFDVDEEHNTVTKEIDFTIIGGLEEAIVSDPPEWDTSISDLPENISDYVEAGNFLDYEAETDDITFKIGAKDDRGIAAVDFTVYTLNSFDNSTGETDTSDTTKLLTQSLSQSESDGDWGIYEYTWESISYSDNYYLCEFDIQDNDEVANHLYIRVVLETDNIATPTADMGGGAPGFLLLPVILTLIGSVRIISWRRRKREV